MEATPRPFGDHLREWRQRRRLSQLALAGEARISSRHLSFLETGRAHPSREMIFHLCERLAVPLRERNQFYLAAGFAPAFPSRDLSDPALTAAREAVDLVLKGHEPFPALAVDRHWRLVASNRVVPLILEGIDPDLVKPPVNVIRLSLHPGGLAPRIRNFAAWKDYLLFRLREQIEISGDEVLKEMLHEFLEYPAPSGAGTKGKTAEIQHNGMVVPFEIEFGEFLLSFISTTTVFGTPIDVTLSELAIESFFPADRQTGEALRHLTAGLFGGDD